MKAFRFSLQPLRLLREQKERVAQKRYVEALRATDEAAAKLDAGFLELSTSWTAFCEEVADGATFSKLHQTRAWCGEIEQRCEQLTAVLKAAQLAAQEAWHEMSVATRERKALDQLRDKFRRAYDNDVQRDEQKELDEMGLRLNSSASNQSESVPTLMEKI